MILGVKGERMAMQNAQLVSQTTFKPGAASASWDNSPTISSSSFRNLLYARYVLVLHRLFVGHLAIQLCEKNTRSYHSCYGSACARVCITRQWHPFSSHSSFLVHSAEADFDLPRIAVIGKWQRLFPLLIFHCRGRKSERGKGR